MALVAIGSPGSAQAQSPASGPGGPILVITTSANPFSQYFAEILRAEGLNEFALQDVSTVTAATLASYDVAILGDMTLSGAQVAMLSTWVNGGGNLIASRPDPQLGSLLGLSGPGAQLGEGYLRVDTSRAPGTGIVGETIQYHGFADTWSLNGATSVASLFSDASTATGSAAVTLRSVGSNGGQAGAFAFDVARSVVVTRQGNPDWAGQDRDGIAPVRSNDMFMGVGGEADWVDLNKVAIPQADELQRLLANIIGMVTADRKPLPRFWYLPRDERAAVVMTGDDHGTGGTSERFDIYNAASPAGCNVAAWECVRGTSYIYPGTPLSNARAAQYAAAGFEIGLHVNTNCSNYTQASLQDTISSQLAEFRAVFPSLPPVVSNRTHCIVFSDWATQPKVELANGIRMDTNYYYFPGAWALNRPGFFTGSGIPMRFGDVDGTMIDVYQATTQMTDESEQTYPFTIDALLNGATGPSGYYGAFTANMHTDQADLDDETADSSRAIVASAQARGVPVVSAQQMLTWVDGRNSSSFGAMAWTGNALTFTVDAGSGADGLRGMVPANAGAGGAGGALTSVRRNGAEVAVSRQQIKGVNYAFFDAIDGSYVATYNPSAANPGAGGTPTTAGPSAGPGGSSPAAQNPSARSRCLTVSLNKRRVRLRRLTTITATVRRGGRAAAGVRVTLTAKGSRYKARKTNKNGRARFVVRPRRKGTLRVRVVGVRPPCKTPTRTILAR